MWVQLLTTIKPKTHLSQTMLSWRTPIVLGLLSLKCSSSRGCLEPCCRSEWCQSQLQRRAAPISRKTLHFDSCQFFCEVQGLVLHLYNIERWAGHSLTDNSYHELTQYSNTLWFRCPLSRWQTSGTVPACHSEGDEGPTWGDPRV